MGINFRLMGAAIVAMGSGAPTRSHAPALGVAFTAVTALIGYAYSVTALGQVATFIPMALHTAALFLLMATAVLCCTPEEGLVGAIIRRTPGGRVLRRMLPARPSGVELKKPCSG